MQEEYRQFLKAVIAEFPALSLYATMASSFTEPIPKVHNCPRQPAVMVATTVVQQKHPELKYFPIPLGSKDTRLSISRGCVAA